MSRLRLLAGCTLLLGLAFVQDPGFLTSDTKFDLAVAPADFLSRALHLWDGEGAFGQLQNQAYGYLWPMGPFFLGGWLLAVPGWVVQRLWLGLVLAVAFAGAAKLARALGVRSDFACLLAGAAFALSPRMLSTLGPISIEAWPSALAPWVLLPLVIGSRRGSPRTWAGLAALAVAMVGGVNAAATFAVIPLGVVWLLTRAPGPRRRALMLWWPVFTLLATMWWLVPLFVMGAYSPPFLDYIETTAVTTFPTTVFDILRGTSDWVPYLDPESRAGSDLVTTPYLALDSGVVLLIGFAGLLSRHTPERRFLALGLLVGVLMVGAGHTGSVEGWFAEPVRALLDGALAPLRNVHKFDPVVRLPLVLGLAFAVDAVLRAGRRVGAGERPAPLTTLLERVNRGAFVALAVAVVAAAAAPAVLGRISPAGATLAVPEYWTQTADWLAEHDDGGSSGGTALLAPGSGFGEYVWGLPRDEPMQWLARSPWAVRNVIPLTPGANIRMLTTVEEAFAQGRGSAGLSSYLRRAGVRFLVVRNDLTRDDDVPDPVLVHQAIDDSPGVARVASFGPPVGGESQLDVDGMHVVLNDGWQSTYPAVEVYEVAAASPAVAAATPPVVVGGPEDLLDLADLGVIRDEPTELAVDRATGADAARAPTRVILTDGLRDRERFFARSHDAYSAVLGPGDVRRTGSPARDYDPGDDERWATKVRLDGAAAISASSSTSDADHPGGAVRAELPYAAVDGSPDTAWRSGSGQEGHAWWRVDLDGARDLGTVTLGLPPDGQPTQMVRVETANGSAGPVRLRAGERSVVDLGDAAGSTSWVRVEDASSTTGNPLALSEVTIPGLRVDRSLVLPVLPESWGDPDAIVLRADRDARTGCAEVGSGVRCAADRAVQSEEPLGLDRVVTLADDASYPVDVRVTPRPGRRLDRLALKDQPVDVLASSTGVPDPRASAIAAVDDDPGTTWLAATDDLRPTLSLSWLGARRVTGLALSVDPDTAVRAPTKLTLSWPGGRLVVPVEDGRARFPAIRTDRLEVEITSTAPAGGLEFDGSTSILPAGISEIRVVGVPYLPLDLPDAPVRFRCGTGPSVSVNGERFETAVTAAPSALLQGATARASLCGTHDGPTTVLSLRAGENVVSLRRSPAADVSSVVLGRPTAAAQPVASGVTPRTAVTRTIRPAPGAAVVVLHENTNPGWRATQGGARLAPVVVDGWQQGFRVGDDTAPVRVSFAPDHTYRLGLLAGLVAAMVLLGALVAGRRYRRRADDPPVGERALPAVVVVGIALAGCGLVGGWTGVLVGALVAGVTCALESRLPALAPWLLSAPCVAAAAAYAVLPWGGSSGWAGHEAWPAYAALVPLVGVLVSASGLRPRRLSLRAGRSTRR